MEKLNKAVVSIILIATIASFVINGFIIWLFFYCLKEGVWIDILFVLVVLEYGSNVFLFVSDPKWFHKKIKAKIAKMMYPLAIYGTYMMRLLTAFLYVYFFYKAGYPVFGITIGILATIEYCIISKYTKALIKK